MGRMDVLVCRAAKFDPLSDELLDISTPLVARWLVGFLQDECSRRRGFHRAVVGLSGGVDSAVSAALCARAFGPENVLAVRMPYRTSSQDSLAHARLVVEAFGLQEDTIDISAMVDGYAQHQQGLTPIRLGNLCARCRMSVLFDQGVQVGGLPIGTGNKSERMMGYYTWHGDDAPPINPLGDLFKTQVWALAKELGVPEEVTAKVPTADLVPGQTDEGDLGITYADADRVLAYLLQGYKPAKLVELGFDRAQVELVSNRVASTHWKRRTATVAMLSDTAINESYLRPVDY